jgi:hypothetical protein
MYIETMLDTILIVKRNLRQQKFQLLALQTVTRDPSRSNLHGTRWRNRQNYLHAVTTNYAASFSRIVETTSAKLCLARFFSNAACALPSTTPMLCLMFELIGHVFSIG